MQLQIIKVSDVLICKLVDLVLMLASSMHLTWGKLSIPTVVSVVFVLLLLPTNGAIAVSESYRSTPSYTVAAIVATCLVWLLMLLMQEVFFQIRAGNKAIRSALGYATPIAAVYLLILLMVWPGFWIWDEYGIFASIQTEGLEMSTWQGWLTVIYYSSLMLIVPSAVAVVAFQLLLGVAVGAYAAYVASELGRKSIFGWLTAAIFLFFPVVFNAFYPFRSTPIAFILAAVVIRQISLIEGKGLARYPSIEFLIHGILLLTCAVWRTEAVAFLPLLFVSARYLGFSLSFHRPGMPRRLIAVLLLIGFGTGLFAMNSKHSNPKYQITATISPLSMLLQTKSGRNDENPNIELMSNAVGIDYIRDRPDAFDIPSFWEGDSEGLAVRQGFEAHLNEFYRGFAGLIFEEPLTFWDARWQMFLGTNGLAGGQFGDHGLEHFQYASDGPQGDVGTANSRFLERNALSVPFPQERAALMRALYQVDLSFTKQSVIGHVVWSLMLVYALLFAALVSAVIQKRWGFALISAVNLFAAFMVFLTAPATMFMYYFPTYLVSWILVSFAMAILLRQMKIKRT